MTAHEGGDNQSTTEGAGGEGDAGAAAARPRRGMRLLEPSASEGQRHVPSVTRKAQMSLPTREKMERFTRAKMHSSGVQASYEAERFAAQCARLRQLDARRTALPAAGPTPASAPTAQRQRQATALATEMHMRRAVRQVETSFHAAAVCGEEARMDAALKKMSALSGLCASAAGVLGDRGSALKTEVTKRGEALRDQRVHLAKTAGVADPHAVAREAAPAGGHGR